MRSMVDVEYYTYVREKEVRKARDGMIRWFVRVR